MNLNTEDKEVSLDYLKDTKIFNQLKKSFDQLEKGQTILCALSSGTEDKSLTLIKVGTLLSFSIVKKMLTNGYNPKDFTDDDWKEIANKVADLGILSDGRSYTRFVFKLYADYIKLSVNVNKDVFII